MTSDDLCSWISALSKAFSKLKGELDELDTPVGDGDHGSSMSRGFAAAHANISQLCGKQATPPSVILHTASNAFVEATGGASGLLFATLLKELGTACKDRELLDSTAFQQGLSASVIRIMQIGKAEIGDKTLLDSLVPAATEASENSGHNLLNCVTATAAAAKCGAFDTQQMSAKRGRGRYVADGGKGHIDPGARTIAYMIEILRQQLESSR